MKRLKFKKPFNGMDNAKKLIPESYKVDGNEFEITDGNETYRVKWSSLINEGIILTSSNKGQINEDMNKIKHLMGFKSQDTLGTVKGADRLDENKKFGNILNKTKRLLNESAITEVEEEIDESIEEGEHIKSGMGGSNKGKSRTDKTEVLKKDSKKGRRKADKEATKDINEDDVANFQDALGSNPKVVNAAKKLNTPIEKIEAAVKFINNIAGDDDALIGKIIRAIKKDDSDVVNELENSELADLNKDGELSSYEEKRGSAIEKAMEAPVDETYEDDYYDFDDTTTSIEGEPGYNQSDINPIDTDLLSQIDPTNTKAGREAKKYGQDDVRKDTSQPKKGIHPLDPRKHALPYDLDSYGPDDLPTPPSEEEEQAAQVYEDRFDQVFEGMYVGEGNINEEDLNEIVSFEDTKYADEFDDYDDSFYAAKKAWEVKRIPKLKAKVIKMANELNNMISIKDGLGYEIDIKWYDSNVTFDEIEFNDNQMNVTYRDIYNHKNADTETYDLNDYSVYEDGLYGDDGLMQVLKKAIKGYKKKTSNVQNKTNFYQYYIVDMDENIVLDGFESKEDAIEAKIAEGNPSIKVTNIKGLERLNLQPINVGG